MKYAKFAGTIKKAMKKKGLSLRALSRETGIEVSFLSKILSGDRNPPPDAYIVKIAKILEIDPDILIIQAGRVPDDVMPMFQYVMTELKSIGSEIKIMGKKIDTVPYLRVVEQFLKSDEGKKALRDGYKKLKK
jgi:transcriptional regulator with XRE-family HTH domain